MSDPAAPAAAPPPRRATIVYGGKVIFEGPPPSPSKITVHFKKEDRQHILETVGRRFNLPAERDETWWKEVQKSCAVFLALANLERRIEPTQKEWEAAVAAAKRFRDSLKPLLAAYDLGRDTGIDDAFTSAHHFVEMSSRRYRRSTTRHGVDYLIEKMIILYQEAFSVLPATTSSGPFVRFVQACIKTTGQHIEAPSGSIIQCHVRRSRRAPP